MCGRVCCCDINYILLAIIINLTQSGNPLAKLNLRSILIATATLSMIFSNNNNNNITIYCILGLHSTNTNILFILRCFRV